MGGAKKLGSLDSCPVAPRSLNLNTLALEHAPDLGRRRAERPAADQLSALLIERPSPITLQIEVCHNRKGHRLEHVVGCHAPGFVKRKALALPSNMYQQFFVRADCFSSFTPVIASAPSA